MKRISVAGLLAASVLLSGCSAPEVDLEAAYAWAERHQTASGEALGSAMVTAAPDDEIIQYATEVTMRFEEPVALSGFRVSCFGGVTAEALVVVITDDSSVAMPLDVVCDESDHVREYVETEVTEVTFAAASPAPTTAVLFVDGEP